MLTFLRLRSRARLIALGLAVLVAGGACLVALGIGGRGHPAASVSSSASVSARTVAVSPEPAPAPSTPQSDSASVVRALPATDSADVYAAAVARALWNVDYGAVTRDAVIQFWRGQLAPVLPTGTPPGTTVAGAQAAGMSTVESLLPSAAMWSTLAGEHTTSSFTVTGVSEPPSWIAAVSSGRIADPGLTAREVIGVQTLAYGTGAARRTTEQTQQLDVAMLCPPTTSRCSVEIFPPGGAVDTSAG